MQAMPEPSSDRIIKSISVIHRKTGMYLNERLGGLGLSSGLLPVLMCLCMRGTMSQNALCEELYIDKSSVAKTVAKLEAAGFITREQNPGDCRCNLVSPSPRSMEIYPRLQEITQGWADQVTAGLSGVEQAVFCELLQRVQGNIGEYFQQKL